MFITIDGSDIITCMASEYANLHPEDIASGTVYEVDNAACSGYTVGDEYTPGTQTFTSHPENYPLPSDTEIKYIMKGLKDEIKSWEEVEKDLDGQVSDIIAALQAQYDYWVTILTT